VASAAPAPTGRPWAILQHVAHEGPGSIEGALAAAGFATTIVRLDLGEALPAADRLGGLVVMGGPMGVHDDDDYAWLAPERQLIGAVVALDRPVLGVCLGSQQLAAALGAQVTTGPVEEVGPGQVELTPAGRTDPVFGPEYHGLSGTSVPCVHWHRDTFALPVGSTHLAATRTYPHQAFRMGRRVYGLQFHVELDAGLAALWRPLLPDGVTLPASDVARVESTGRRLLQRFVDVATSDVATGDKATSDVATGDKATSERATS